MPDRLQPEDSAIDAEQVTALFGGLDPAMRRLLLDAAQRDLAEWTDHLIAAFSADDAAACHRARHALKGLCGNFGASGLLALCAMDLSQPGLALRLQSARAATNLALAQMVAGLGD